jgi:hypothetical protein
MSGEQVGGIFRAVLSVGLGYLAGKGIIASGAVADLVATLSAAVVAGWSAYTNRPSAIGK